MVVGGMAAMGLAGESSLSSVQRRDVVSDVSEVLYRASETGGVLQHTIKVELRGGGLDGQRRWRRLGLNGQRRWRRKLQNWSWDKSRKLGRK